MKMNANIDNRHVKKLAGQEDSNQKSKNEGQYRCNYHCNYKDNYYGDQVCYISRR